MSKKILIVDDEYSLVKTMAMRLAASGYDVEVANDALFAVKQAHEYRPDLILLDIRLPAGSGFMVYEILQLSSETLTIPVVFMTAFGDPEMEAKVLNMGARDYIEKPFDIEELLLVIERHFNNK